MRIRSAPRSAIAAVGLVALLAGCDTNNGGGVLGDLAGSYLFTEVRFVPNAPGIDEADVLTRLDPAQTDIEVDSEGRAFFFLEEGGVRRIAEASVTATRSTATFRPISAQDVEYFGRYLLPGVLTVSHDGVVTRLNGTISIRANLQAFDPATYPGLTDVPGTLTVRMERQ